MYRRFRDQLDNGVKIVTVEVPHLHSALLAIYVRCGSRHELPKVNGVSHFLEHMLFRGSERFPDTRVMNGLVEDAGGNLNAVTMRDQTFFYTPVEPGSLEVGFEVLGDLVCAPRLPDMPVERRIILEEMLDEIDPRGRDIDTANLVRRMVFGDHPLSQKIAGTRKSVRQLSLEDLRAYYRRFYCGANLVVCAAGPVKRAQVVALAKRAFGALPRGRKSTERAPAIARRGPELLQIDHDETQTELVLAFPCPTDGHPDYPAVSVLRSVLDDGLSSRLPLEIVERRGLAYAVHANLDIFSDTALFEIESACAPAKSATVVAALAEILEELRAKPLPEAELARVKRRQRIGLSFALDDLNSLAGWYGATELFRQPESFEARCQAIESLTAQQVQRVARRVFARENLRLCAVGPKRATRKQQLLRALDNLG